MLKAVKNAVNPSEFTVDAGQLLGKLGGVHNLSLQTGEGDISTLFYSGEPLGMERLPESPGGWCVA